MCIPGGSANAAAVPEKGTSIECASLTMISFPDGLISTGDRAFEGAAPLLAPICLGKFIIIRISDVEQRHASFLNPQKAKGHLKSGT